MSDAEKLAIAIEALKKIDSDPKKEVFAASADGIARDALLRMGER